MMWREKMRLYEMNWDKIKIEETVSDKLRQDKIKQDKWDKNKEEKIWGEKRQDDTRIDNMRLEETRWESIHENRKEQKMRSREEDTAKKSDV